MMPDKKMIKEMIKDFNENFKVEATYDVLESHVDDEGRTIVDRIELKDISVVRRNKNEEVKK